MKLKLQIAKKRIALHNFYEEEAHILYCFTKKEGSWIIVISFFEVFVSQQID